MYTQIVNGKSYELPPESDGVQWPLTIYICRSCARPTMFKEDKCCGGFQHEILVMPVAVVE